LACRQKVEALKLIGTLPDHASSGKSWYATRSMIPFARATR
jgi:hypothetical protein